MKYYILLSLLLGMHLGAMEQVNVSSQTGLQYRVRYNLTQQGTDITSVTPIPHQAAQNTRSCLARSKCCCLVVVHGGALAALALWMYLRLHSA